MSLLSNKEIHYLTVHLKENKAVTPKRVLVVQTTSLIFGFQGLIPVIVSLISYRIGSSRCVPTLRATTGYESQPPRTERKSVNYTALWMEAQL